MYQGKRISVAMAAYNGAEFIGEQLDSILNQSVLPDEIVISDDGSRDQTVAIAAQYAAQYRDRVTLTVLTDNPRHGIGGNFEWAIRHCGGDYIFICGQDDIGLPEKVRRVADLFLAHPKAAFVCHDLICADAAGTPQPDWPVNSMLRKLEIPQSSGFHIPRGAYLESVLGSVLISGPAACISKSFVDQCLPIPPGLAEDWWIQFCAVAVDGAYYWNEVLTRYRIHNSTTHSVGMGFFSRAKKTLGTVRAATHRSSMLLQFSRSAGSYMDRVCRDCEGYASAAGTVRRISEIGEQVFTACQSGRIRGALLLTRLYRRDQRYRRIGRNNYLTQLANILLYSKARRRKEMGL